MDNRETMKMTENLYVTNRNDWRAWLEENHKTKKEVWLNPIPIW
jgi:uncharacterized protein YdeI (YjbR/CyaY-like superfamily)